MPESKGVIRRIVERDGGFKVSFPNHSGYFSVAEGENRDDLIARLRDAAQTGTTITFRFDARLKITELL
ncbi:MAG: hypothetical protein ACK4PK_08330 [Alphaproteobacteria bacterium]|jgi:hypothetical protein